MGLLVRLGFCVGFFCSISVELLINRCLLYPSHCFGRKLGCGMIIAFFCALILGLAFLVASYFLDPLTKLLGGV